MRAGAGPNPGRRPQPPRTADRQTKALSACRPPRHRVECRHIRHSSSSRWAKRAVGKASAAIGGDLHGKDS